ncbi:MAG: hypothetical protein V4691_09290 [Pseudomonadota bacterium]
MAKYSSPEQILERLQKWQAAQASITSLTHKDAIERLDKAGISKTEIEEKLDRLTLGGARATPRVLANYIDLHALDRLDEAAKSFDVSTQPEAANIRAVLQGMEITLLNVIDLSKRIKKDIETRKFDDAEEKYRWVSSFVQTLHSLSLLNLKLPASGRGHKTGILHSDSAQRMLESLKEIHQTFREAGLLEAAVISEQNIHTPTRNLTHQAFVDTTFTDIFLKNLQHINLPGVEKKKEESEQDFYRRFVGSEVLELAVNELDQTGDNFLRQFRAYHQISEVLVAQANSLIAASITTILSADGNLLEACDNMMSVLAMLDIMNQNVVPILRNLSVNKYQDIRGSLGITSGSHSPHIKHSLFQPLYELFVEAVQLRIMKLKTYDEIALTQRIRQIAENPTKDHSTYDDYTLLKQAHGLHLALRTWRDLHMQFVKTQIGMPQGNETPTASISGSPSAVKAAHGMRQGAHGEKDVIVLIYETLLGKEFPIVAPFSNVFRDDQNADNIVDSMLNVTAKVVATRSAQVQNRVHGY